MAFPGLSEAPYRRGWYSWPESLPGLRVVLLSSGSPQAYRDIVPSLSMQLQHSAEVQCASIRQRLTCIARIPHGWPVCTVQTVGFEGQSPRAENPIPSRKTSICCIKFPARVRKHWATAGEMLWNGTCAHVSILLYIVRVDTTRQAKITLFNFDKQLPIL